MRGPQHRGLSYSPPTVASGLVETISGPINRDQDYEGDQRRQPPKTEDSVHVNSSALSALNCPYPGIDEAGEDVSGEVGNEHGDRDQQSDRRNHRVVVLADGG